MARRPSSPTASSAAAEDPDAATTATAARSAGDARSSRTRRSSSPRDAPDESASRRASGSVWTMIRRATSGARARTCAARASALWASTEGAATSAASPSSSSNATATAQRGVRGRAGLVRLGDGEEAVEEVGVALGPLALGDVGVRLGELGDGEGCESPGGRDETREDGAGEETAIGVGEDVPSAEQRRLHRGAEEPLQGRRRADLVHAAVEDGGRGGGEEGLQGPTPGVGAIAQGHQLSLERTTLVGRRRGGEEGGQHGSHPRERGEGDRRGGRHREGRGTPPGPPPEVGGGGNRCSPLCHRWTSPSRARESSKNASNVNLTASTWVDQNPNSKKFRGHGGIEPPTISTLRRYHATRPMPQRLFSCAGYPYGYLHCR